MVCNDGSKNTNSLCLSPSQIDEFNKNGYFVFRGVYGRNGKKEEIEKLKKRAAELLDSFDIQKEKNICSFETEKNIQSKDEYFRTSGDKVRFFFEEGVFGPQGDLQVCKEKAINKIGHDLHNQDAVFRSFSYSDDFLNVVKQLGYTKPAIVQSMYIFKQPYVGGFINAHQDSSFIYTQPESCLGIWVALEDATKTNGCLYVVEGSHKGELQRRYKYIDEERQQLGFDREVSYDISGAVPLEVEEGSVVFLHGRLVHFSHKNLSEKSRHAYTIHIIETQNCIWSKENWIQATAPFPSMEDVCNQNKSLLK